MNTPEPDGDALDELKSVGADLTRPVQVVHYLYCRKQYDAERMGKSVAEEGFSVEVRRGALGDNWLVLAKRTQMLNEAEIAELRSFFEKLARNVSGGEYDGWEVATNG